MLMRLWDHYTKPVSSSGSVALSAVLHVLVIGAAVRATLPPAGLESQTGYELANRPYFIPPPNRVPSQEGSAPSIRYFDLAPEGEGSGLGAPGLDARLPVADPDASRDVGDLGQELTTSPPIEERKGNDSVFTIVEVDSAASIDPRSAAPTYPPALLEARVEGLVHVQYVIDSTGYADVSTLKIVRSTHPAFSAAVREVLPRMLFSPAKIGTRAVRQLAEQDFAFRIRDPVPDTVVRVPARRPPVP